MSTERAIVSIPFEMMGITGPSPATRPDSECGSPASRTAALLAGSDELPAGCQTQSAATDNGTPDEGSNAGDIGSSEAQA